MSVLLQMYLLLLGSFASLGRSELRLELVQVVLRHGERTPSLKEIHAYRDPQNVSIYEPWGLAQLTNRGKLTEYRIGVMLRQRYADFLGSIYHPRDIYAVSTNIDRTKMSLQLMLAGLYPPHTIQLWNLDLPWLAIPTHYTPERVDTLLNPYNCSAYKAALTEAMEMKDVRDKITAYEDLFRLLSEKSGLIVEKPLPFTKIFQLLMAQDVTALEYEIHSYTTRLKRLNGGILIDKFIDNMNVKGERTNPRKMYVYSGHEVNIAAFAKAHNISEPRIPDYGSAFIFEKLRDETGKLYVKIILWTGSSTEKLMTIKLAHCDEVCPLEIYLELVRDVIPSYEETICLWNDITREELLELFAERINLN